MAQHGAAPHGAAGGAGAALGPVTAGWGATRSGTRGVWSAPRTRAWEAWEALGPRGGGLVARADAEAARGGVQLQEQLQQMPWPVKVFIEGYTSNVSFYMQARPPHTPPSHAPERLPCTRAGTPRTRFHGGRQLPAVVWCGLGGAAEMPAQVSKGAMTCRASAAIESKDSNLCCCFYA